MNAADTHARSRNRWISISAVSLALIVAAILLWRARPDESARAGQGPPPAVVTAARAEQQTWSTQLAAIGTLEAERGVEITTAAAGIVDEIHFDSGDKVERGALIAQLDDEADRARLATLTAQLEQARSDLKRSRRLLKGGAASAAEAEQSATAVETLRAQIAEQRALIDDKRILAPFAGELGIRQIDLGQFVQPSEPIVSLQQIAPILVNFSLPERHYGQVQRGQSIELTVDAWPGRRFEGTVSAVNPQIDEQTRNFQAQGRLANDERLLRPGMFADVTVTLPEQRKVITTPATAISYSPAGDSVYLVRQERSGDARSAAGQADGSRRKTPMRTVTRVAVQTGERRGERIAVLQGIEAGDIVVTAGQLKLFEGAPVIVSSETARPAPRTAGR